MKTSPLSLFTYLFSMVFACECEQIFTCTRDKIGNLTQIQNGKSCLYTWISDASIGFFLNLTERAIFSDTSYSYSYMLFKCSCLLR